MNQPGGRIKAPVTRRGRLSASAVRKSMRASSQASVGPGMRLSHDRRGGLHIFGNPLRAPVTVDLAGMIHGPWSASLGAFVVVNRGAGTCTQQALGTVRPSVPPQNEVWIDLTQTYGRVYLTLLG